MIFAMRIVSGVWLVLVTALAGCDRSQEVIDQQACTILCDCLGDPSPGGQEECVAICVGQLAPINQGCEACIGEFADRCSMIERECELPCVGPQPDPETDSTSGGFPE